MVSMEDMDFKEEKFDGTHNLIANYLPLSLNQDEVKNLFQRVGAVKNCKLMRNYETGESLGYALIEYESAILAKKAIESINGMNLDGKTIRVSYATKTTPSTEKKDANVYICGLPGWVNEDKLKDLFIPFGEITSLKVLDNKPGFPARGIGFVRFAFKSDAERAINSMAGKKLPEAAIPLTVKFAMPPAPKQPSAPGVFGSILNAASSMRYNPMATALTTPIMQQAKDMQAGGAGGASLMPASGHSSLITGEVHSIYVFGLSTTATDLSLYELFSPFGGVMNVKVMRDASKDDNPCKGFGFVNFRKYEDAYQAVIAMNGFMYDGKVLHVSFKKQKGGSASYTDGSAGYSASSGSFHASSSNYSVGPGSYLSGTGSYSSAPGSVGGNANAGTGTGAPPGFNRPQSAALPNQSVSGVDPQSMQQQQQQQQQQMQSYGQQEVYGQDYSRTGQQAYNYQYGHY